MTRSPSISMRPFEDSLPMALLRARETTMRPFRALLSEHDLTEQQWRVLRALAATEPGLEVRDLAEATFLLGPSLSRILGHLETRGLIVRLAVAEDQRRARIALADAGWRVVRAVAPGSEARYAAIERKYGAAELATLLRMLDELAALDLES